MSSTIREKIRAFIVEQILETDAEGLDDETDLVKGGILDSFGVTQLIVYLEQTFNVQLPPERITAANFRTIGDIEAMIAPLVEGEGDGAEAARAAKAIG